MYTVFHQGCVNKEDRVTYFETREQAEKFARRHRLNHMDYIIAIVEGEYSSLSEVPRVLVSAPTGATKFSVIIACKPLYSANPKEIVCPAPKGIRDGDVCAYWTGSAFRAGGGDPYGKFLQNLSPALEVYAIAAMGRVCRKWYDASGNAYTPPMLEEAIELTKMASQAWHAAKADVSAVAALREEEAVAKAQLAKLEKKPVPKGCKAAWKKEKGLLADKIRDLGIAVSRMELQASKDAKTEVLVAVLNKVPTA